MNVLSLFDGMSCGQIALNRLGIKVDNYYASEIDKYAIKVAQENFPNTIQLGDISKFESWDIKWNKIDLVIGGSPCQGFSFAGKQLNFEDPRSKLFFKYLEVCEKVGYANPNMKFFLENVRMKKEYQDIITKHMGIDPIIINSSLVSAQNRVRLYWTNIGPITQPEDKGILLKDIIQNENIEVQLRQSDKIKFENKVLIIPEATKKGYAEINPFEGVDLSYLSSKTRRGRRMDKKSNCLTTNYEYCWYNGETIRKLTPIECERLQTVPDNYTSCVSDNNRYKMLGNGWTVDVIAHFFKNLNK